MKDDTGTYDTPAATQLSLDTILGLMGDAGARKIYIKKLAPNDNSKNQPYFGFHLTDLPFIPTGPMEASDTTSKKTKDPTRQIKYQAPVKLRWIDADGCQYPAPNAKLIYYPQYPEVRFSGFLLGSKVSLSQWMSPDKQGRAEGRWLLLGVADDETVYAYLATPDSALATELEQTELTQATSIFYEIDLAHRRGVRDTRAALLQKLLEIHNMGWIAGCKLDKHMVAHPYKAQNGGGYTLEALLGVSPNGVAEPDYLGWEVKQFSVKDFPRKSAKPTTLMTPEPNGGVYSLQSAAAFVRQFGYPDKRGKPDRLNFGGKHLIGKKCTTSNMTLNLDGFDTQTRKITKASGAITLTDQANTIAASWSFAKLMDHWKRKHSQAVYIPCRMRQARTGGSEYLYGCDVELGKGTDFEMFLSAMLSGYVYYDPGIKLEKASDPSSIPKRRSQFRVNHKHLGQLYKSLEFVDVTA
jgi:hypothetical protein